ncbi:hypothetical protein SAMN04487955_103223 [Halomonas korlensis]|uniref:Uncharacterized protein n=1 Tax=Halomonas korlensis TaxID=463301 RepID=A0A1I7GT18_9GAMM|nr:hypothetical protein SAMN04487955_103223 [Halomonas korlensis]
MTHIKPHPGVVWHHGLIRLARPLPEPGLFKHLKMHLGGIL